MTYNKKKYSMESDVTMVQMLPVTQRDFERTMINMLKNLTEKGRPHVWKEGEFSQGLMRTLWPPLFMMRNKLLKLLRIPCMWWIASILLLSRILLLTLVFNSLVMMYLGVKNSLGSPCAQPYTFIQPSRFPGICWSFSKSSMNILLSSFFFFLMMLLFW